MITNEEHILILSSRIHEIEDRFYDLELVLKTVLIAHANLIDLLNTRVSNVEKSTGAKPN